MSLSVVIAGELGVSLQANAHENVATAHTNELLDHVVHLLRMDVLQHVRAEHHIEAAVLVWQVGQDAGFDVTLGQHVRALLLKDGAGELNAPSALAMLAHKAHQSTVASASVKESVELHLLNHIDREPAAPAALAGVSALCPSLVVQLLVGSAPVDVAGATLGSDLASLRSKEKLILQVCCREHGGDLALKLRGLAAAEQSGEERP
mmetsp:Transcript_27472/g.60031  ORF Transcript_27472/g.60031 Transcript_27472/m.60031 type:complete len:206 (+) Transcript_27472:851-1468(+)